MRATGILMHRLDFNLFSLHFGRSNILMMGSFIECFHMPCEIENQLTIPVDHRRRTKENEMMAGNVQRPETLNNLN